MFAPAPLNNDGCRMNGRSGYWNALFWVDQIEYQQSATRTEDRKRATFSDAMCESGGMWRVAGKESKVFDEGNRIQGNEETDEKTGRKVL